MKKRRKVLLFLLAVTLLSVFAGCGKKNDTDEHGKGVEDDNIQHIIGVAVYAQDLQGAVAACEEEELYYIAGSGTRKR